MGSPPSGCRRRAHRSRTQRALLLQSFADLDELADAVVAEQVHIATDVVRSAAAAADDSSRQARSALDAFVDLIEDDPRVGRLLLTETFGSSGRLSGHRAEFISLAR